MKNSKKRFDISGSIGNLYQIEGLVTKLNNDNTQLEIKVPLMFWGYLVLIESAINDLSEIFYEIALTREKNDYIKDFEERLKEGNHIMFRKLKSYAVDWGLTLNDKNTFLHKRNLRNEIAHANIWYDSERKKIQLRGQKFMDIEDFLKEFYYILDFFKELTVKLNNNNTDLEDSILNITNKFRKEFLKIARSGPKKEAWKNNVGFDWEK